MKIWLKEKQKENKKILKKYNNKLKVLSSKCVGDMLRERVSGD